MLRFHSFFHGQIGFILSKVKFQIVAATPAFPAAPRSRASVSTKLQSAAAGAVSRKMQHYNQYKDNKKHRMVCTRQRRF